MVQPFAHSRIISNRYSSMIGMIRAYVARLERQPGTAITAITKK